MLPKLIHKDHHILVIDKPAGMPTLDVHTGNPNTLARWIYKEFPGQAGLKEAPGEAGLLHRLDNDTSGVIIAAKTDKAYAYLRKKWNENKILKEYICLVVGQSPTSGKIAKLIAHHPGKKHKMIVVENPEDAKKLKARYAETEYNLIETYFDYSLLKIKITTGLRHQIRCHLSSIGHPIAGDKLYQRTKHKSRDWLNLDRHFLHACRIGFDHPSSGKFVEFEAALPDDLQEILKLLN